MASEVNEFNRFSAFLVIIRIAKHFICLVNIYLSESFTLTDFQP
jgi:hypothetical protein